MIPLFLGLTAANLVVLCTAFGFGWFAVDASGEATGVYDTHMLLGIGAGLLATMTHMTVFTYFMATSKWLQAATDKAGCGLERFVGPALSRKRRAFGVSMLAVVLTMAAMFAGAGADPTMMNRLWPGEVHLMAAAVAIAVNAFAAVGEFSLIKRQGVAVDEAARLIGQDSVEQT